MRALRIALVMTAVAFPISAFGQDADATWQQLHFLLGTWEARTAGGSAGAQASGTYAFREDVKGNAITRTSSADSCTGPKAYDCQHNDTLTLYRDAGAVRALYIDSEGHVIHYTVTTPDDHTALFLSSGPGPIFRLRYQLTASQMSGSFGMATPGSQEFHSYLEWSGGKR